MTEKRKALVFAKFTPGETLVASKMEVGSTISGELVNTQVNQYGDTLFTLNIKGQQVTIKPAGTMKSYIEKYAHLLTGKFISFTRRENVTTKHGYALTNFTPFPRRAEMEAKLTGSPVAVKSVAPVANTTSTATTAQASSGPSAKERILAKLKAQGNN